MLSRYVAASAAVLFSLGTASAQLTAVGAVDPTHGFPSSYTDSGNTSLAPCLSNNGLCLLANAVDLLNPNQPFPQNFGGTFPDEFMYWAGDATMPTNNGGQALLVLALTGSFAGGVPLAGDQVVFGRIRLRIDNLQVGSTYHCTTPYGTFDLVAQVAGRRGINFTQDIGIDTPLVFTTALNSGIGPFLRWDSGLPIVDVDGNRYLGDPNVAHTVTGSPTGTNIFRIDGPNVGGPGINTVQTDLFSIVGMMLTVPAPVANFAANPTSGTAPLNVAFTNQSTGSITSFAWTFGDGGTSTLASPSHTYSTAGTFSVSLTVTGPGGSNTRTANNLITVNAPAGAPVANFTASPRSGAAPLNVVFTNTSTGANTFAWSFGDGGTSNVASPSHVYTTPGTYTVALTVTGPGGTNTRTQAGFITVGQPANLRIQSITPGTGGVRNTITVTGCTPNAQIFVLWSTAAGSTPIQLNTCNVITDLASPLILTQGRPRNSSTLDKQFKANRGLIGQTLRLQAVDSGNCAKSPVLVETF